MKMMMITTMGWLLSLRSFSQKKARSKMREILNFLSEKGVDPRRPLSLLCDSTRKKRGKGASLSLHFKKNKKHATRKYESRIVRVRLDLSLELLFHGIGFVVVEVFSLVAQRWCWCFRFRCSSSSLAFVFAIFSLRKNCGCLLFSPRDTHLQSVCILTKAKSLSLSLSLSLSTTLTAITCSSSWCV